MFVNPSLNEIFLISSVTSTIHAASRLSEKCGIKEDENGSFGILPCEEGERGYMLEEFAREYSELTLCPFCFEHELKVQKKQELYAKVAGAAEEQKSEADASKQGQ